MHIGIACVLESCFFSIFLDFFRILGHLGCQHGANMAPKSLGTAMEMDTKSLAFEQSERWKNVPDIEVNQGNLERFCQQFSSDFGRFRGSFWEVLGLLFPKNSPKSKKVRSGRDFERLGGRLGRLLGALGRRLGPSRAPTWGQVGGQDGTKITWKRVPKCNAFRTPSGTRFFRVFMDFGCQHGSMLGQCWHPRPRKIRGLVKNADMHLTTGFLGSNTDFSCFGVSS